MSAIKKGSLVVESSIYSLSIDLLRALFSKIINKQLLFTEETAHTLVILENAREPLDIAIGPSSIIIVDPHGLKLPNSIPHSIVYKQFWVKTCRLELPRNPIDIVKEIYEGIQGCRDRECFINIDKISIRVYCEKAIEIIYMKPYHPICYGIGRRLSYNNELYREALTKYLSSTGVCDTIAYYVLEEGSLKELICINDYERKAYINIPKYSKNLLEDTVKKILLKTVLWSHCVKI